MSEESDSTSVGALALRFVRGRLVAEEAARATLQARTYALLRTITAMSAFVVASLALLNNAEIEISTAGVVLVGSVKPSRPVSIDPEQVVRRLLTIRGVHNYNPRDLKAAVEFLRQFHDRFPLADLVPPAYSLQDVNRAIDYAVQQRPVRVAVRPFGVR